MFDASVQPIDFNVIAIPDEEQPHVILQFVLGVVVPGPGGQKGLLPTGVIKVPLGKEMAITKAKRILEEAEALPDPKPESKIIVAENANEAQQVAAEAAEVERQIRAGDVPVG